MEEVEKCRQAIGKHWQAVVKASEDCIRRRICGFSSRGEFATRAVAVNEVLNTTEKCGMKIPREVAIFIAEKSRHSRREAVADPENLDSLSVIPVCT